MKTHFQQYNSQLKHLSNKNLLLQIKSLVQKERHIHIQVLHHLAEIESRKLFYQLGFSNLFDYAVKELGYSEGAAYRRIKAMKLCKELPDTEQRLISGKLSLSSACQLQTFFEKQEKKAKEEEKRKSMTFTQDKSSSQFSVELKNQTTSEPKKNNNLSQHFMNLQTQAKKVEISSQPMMALTEQEKVLNSKTQDYRQFNQTSSKEFFNLETQKDNQPSQTTSTELLKSKNQQNNQAKRTGFKDSLMFGMQKNDQPKKSFSLEQKKKLIKQAEGCSTRATNKLLSETDPSLVKKREQIRFLGKGKLEIKAVLEESCYRKLEKLKELLSHRNPDLSYSGLLSILLEEALEKHDPGRRKIRKEKRQVQKEVLLNNKIKQDKSAWLKLTSAENEAQHKEMTQEELSLIENNIKHKQVAQQKPTSAENEAQHKKMTQKEFSLIENNIKHKQVAQQKSNLTQENAGYKEINQAKKILQKNIKSILTQKPINKTKKISRAIPASLKKLIWLRDKGQCAYVHPETQRRCSSKTFLQIDHIQPFALNGKTELENLRLLCAGHNRFRNENSI